MMTEAVEEVFLKWGHYFRDIWERTTEEQRSCLRAVLAAGTATFAQIQLVSGLGEAALQRALHTVLRRDLLLCEQDLYRLSMPIFAQWIERYAGSDL